ncbi:MAG: peptidase M61 [Steroidobacteraceae bacterium]|jgi:predicted metalloprotease with PDZ domain
MKRILMSVAICCAASAFGAAIASPGPSSIAPAAPVAAPKDRPYAGEIRLAVNAADIERRIVHVHETLSGIGADTVLLYPKWLPGTHAPEGPIDRLAGIKITANGAPVPWTRDPVDVYAFRLHAAAGVKSLDIDFDYLSPTSPKVGAIEISRDILLLEWNALVLYPAGYFTRQIPVQASIALPAGWQFGSALEIAGASGGETQFKRTSLETLVDSPVYAGRYAARLDLDPSGAVPVHLDLFADRPELLAIKPEQLEAHRSLVQQAYKLYGSHHYSHYDFLYSLSDQIQQNGLEHHQSSEDGSDPEALTQWDKTAFDRDLLAHEFTHSWNGKFRRPADLWTPNYNVPMQDSLLWVYEGQTQYWGQVLTARAGLWTQQQALDKLALTAAYYDVQAGRRWRALQDTTNDEIINPRRPMSWPSWQRFEDYYSEGQLIWLDADTLIRERSQGKRSLDDFARTFFGIDDGSFTTVTYTFEDLVKALNAVEPYDWAAFLRERLDSIGKPAPLDGLRRGGYKLVFTDTPSELLKAHDDQSKRVNLLFSIGVELDDKDGTVLEVLWNSAAFKAKLTESSVIMAINGAAYNADVLKDAIRSAKTTQQPIELIVKNGDRFRVLHLDYHDGLRYPHLEREPSVPARLDDILAARQ